MGLRNNWGLADSCARYTMFLPSGEIATVDAPPTSGVVSGRIIGNRMTWTLPPASLRHGPHAKTAAVTARRIESTGKSIFFERRADPDSWAEDPGPEVPGSGAFVAWPGSRR